MLVRALSCAVLVAGSSSCDIGQSSRTGGEGGGGAAQIDPNDVGSDEDVGAGDLGPTPVELHGQLQVVGATLQDAQGAPVQLKGVSSMWLNWEEDGYAEDAIALKWMRNNWRLSVVRASMGIEPAGAYLADPEKARAQLETIIDNAVAAGVYVIIDWHDHNAHEHQDQAIAFFTEMAAAYGHLPNVLYEPFNEPMQIDWWMVVKPYHEALVAAIRGIDPDNIIILGTPTWSQDVERAVQAGVEGDNLMYTLHFYACTHTEFLRAKGGVAVKNDIALFVTEWGATHADGGTDGVVCLDEAATWHEWLNGHGISWTAWKLDNCQQDSSCLLTPDAPVAGGWTGQYLKGHAPFVRARMQSE
jgi:endoglucanase